MKYIRSYESGPLINDYVAVKETSPKYKVAKNKIYQITHWNSEEYFLSDVFNLSGLDAYTNIGWVKWGEVRHLNDKELKKLDIILNAKKYNI